MTEQDNGVAELQRIADERADDAGTLKIDGKTYKMPKDFKIGELRILERITGTPLGEVNWVSADAFAAVALILKRREDPEFPEDTVDDLTIEWEDVDDEEAAAEALPPSSVASGVQS